MNITFTIYCVLILGVGFYAALRSKDTSEDVFLASRSHNHWASALAAATSTESGFVTLGMVGMGYSVGANCFWIIPAGVMGYMLNWLVLAPRIRPKSAALGAVTVPEFIVRSTGNSRISRAAGVASALAAMLFLTVYTAAQFAAAGKVLSAQFAQPYTLAVLVGSAIIFSYTLLGGFRGVNWTDMIQAAFMLTSLVLIPIFGLIHVGGLEELWRKLMQVDPKLVSFTAGADGLTGWLSATLPWLMLGLAYPGQPHAVVRLMSSKEDRNFLPSAAIGSIWFAVLYAGAILLGMAVRAGYAEGMPLDDKELIMMGIAQTVLPGIMGGLILASIIAAISSTADATMLAAASTAIKDVIPGLADRRPGMMLKIAVTCVAVLSFVLAKSNSPVIFTFVLYAWTGLGASLGPAILYCALLKSPRATATLVGILTGGVGAVFFHSSSLDLLYAFVVSCVAIAVIHLLSKSTTHPSNDNGENPAV